jgi:hypothetical protein
MAAGEVEILPGLHRMELGTIGPDWVRVVESHDTDVGGEGDIPETAAR